MSSAANDSSGSAALPQGTPQHALGPDNWPVLRAVLIFAAVMGAFYTIDYTTFANSSAFRGYLEWIARTSAWMLSQVGCASQATSTFIDQSGGGFRVNIVRGCDALDPSAAFMAAVLASPVAFRRKLPGIFVGVLALMLINLVRIVSLFLVGVYKPAHFEIMHGDIWQAAFIVLAIAFWAVWVLWASGSFRTLPRCVGAFVVFVVVFVALMYLWGDPASNRDAATLPARMRAAVSSTYGRAFRAVGNTLFSSFGSAGRVRFTEPEGFSHYDTIVELRNLERNTPPRQLGGNSRITGYQPTAYLLALILATPLTWSRRWRALLWGLLLVNALVLLRLFILVLAQFLLVDQNGNNPVLLGNIGEFGRDVLKYVNWVVVKSFAGSFVLPLIIWFVVCFRIRPRPAASIPQPQTASDVPPAGS